MKRLFYISLVFNALLLIAGYLAVYKLGGWRYALLKLQRDTSGLYQHRIQQFEKLPAHPGAWVFVGDSQVENAEWHEWITDSVAVLNRGIAGDYTAAVKTRLPEVLRHEPKKIFLWVGVNDLIFGKKAPEIVGYYQELVQQIRSKAPNASVFLLGLPPVNNDLRRSGTDNERIRNLNQGIEQTARDFAVPYIDLYAPLANADGNLSVQFTEDGLHLNGLGYVVVLNTLKPFTSH
ncbi:MAG: hypothetical protein JNJ57_21870 [Saprospiraceae bacterium]|nr:hypothetical protein [Saprospiraceae bacterium]